MKNENINYKYLIFPFWYLIIFLGGCIFILNLFVSMPYEKWILDHLPLWFSTINILIFGASLLATLFLKDKIWINYLVSMVFVGSLLLLKTSIQKAPDINKIIAIFFGFSYIALRYIVKK